MSARNDASRAEPALAVDPSRSTPDAVDTDALLAQARQGREDAEKWQAFEAVSKVSGAGWSVRHPRTDAESYYVGFGWPMSYEQVLNAVNRGGLGFAPSLEVMLRNAADALAANPSPSPEG